MVTTVQNMYAYFPSWLLLRSLQFPPLLLFALGAASLLCFNLECLEVDVSSSIVSIAPHKYFFPFSPKE